jgi:Na+/melibiose symporter-like transporter
MISWGSVSFSFFMLSFFIKYMPGDVYLNSIVSGFSAVSYLLAGPMKKRFDAKWILFISFTLALMSSLTLFFLTQNGWTNPDHFSMIILLTRCGINLAFCMVFVIHTELFPTSFLATSYGICNFFCRTLTLLAPIVAEI